METMATASDGATAASVRATTASDGATAASAVDTAATEDTTTDPCWTHLPVPSMGLKHTERVMRGGTLRDPVVLSGEETTGTEANELVLRGGHLRDPHAIADLHMEDGKKFSQLQKWHKGL